MDQKKDTFGIDINAGIASVGERALNPNITNTGLWNHTKASSDDPYLELLSPWSLKFSGLITTNNWYRWLLMGSSPFGFIPFNKSLIAKTCSTSVASGTADTNTICRLEDTGGDFSSVSAGDVVYNSTDDVYATVLINISDTELQLDWDAFPDGNEAYSIYDEPDISDNFIYATGGILDGDGSVVADTNTVNHLIDADSTDWTTVVSVDDWAMNLNTGLVAKIDVVAAHDLTLQWDCFPNGNEPYLIFADKITISDASSLINGLIVSEMNISQRFIGAGLTSGRILEDILQLHWHRLRAVETNLGPGAVSRIDNYTVPYSSGTINLTDRVQEPITDGTNGTPRTGELTRPRNQTMTYIMRIK